MNKTQKRIVLVAIDLFNQKRLTNVRNSEIVEAAGISLSNFNYHFGAKKKLVLSVMDYMVEILESKVYGNRMFLLTQMRIRGLKDNTMESGMNSLFAI